MSPLTLKQHDTWPPLRGRAEDQDGLIPLANADAVRVLIKKGTTTVGGTCEVIDPPDADNMNWRYIWATHDLDVTGTYGVELEITWDASSNPPEVETVPNSGVETLIVEADLG